MLISFLSGAAWDIAGNVNVIMIPILLGTLPLTILTPNLVFNRTDVPHETVPRRSVSR
jgi:hypothetical protein